MTLSWHLGSIVRGRGNFSLGNVEVNVRAGFFCGTMPGDFFRCNFSHERFPGEISSGENVRDWFEGNFSAVTFSRRNVRLGMIFGGYYPE